MLSNPYWGLKFDLYIVVMKEQQAGFYDSSKINPQDLKIWHLETRVNQVANLEMQLRYDIEALTINFMPLCYWNKSYDSRLVFQSPKK